MLYQRFEQDAGLTFHSHKEKQIHSSFGNWISLDSNPVIVFNLACKRENVTYSPNWNHMVLICSDAVLLDLVELETHVYETPTVDKMPHLPPLYAHQNLFSALGKN